MLMLKKKITDLTYKIAHILKKKKDILLGRMYFAGSDCYQNFLVFTPMLSSPVLDSNKKVTGYRPEYHQKKLKFNNSVLAEKIFCLLYRKFILNLRTVYELNTWPRNPTKNFTLKDCLFGTVKLLRNKIKSEFAYNGRGIAFDGEGSWSFDDDFARNVVIFGVDNSSSYHTDNLKNNFLALDERPNQGINDSTGAADKKLVVTLVKQIQNFACK